MSTKLSFTAISAYTSCGYKYYLRYKKNYRSIYFSSALAFGSAVDGALNMLLLTNNLEQACSQFDELWSVQYINKVKQHLPEFTEMSYNDGEFDADLMLPEDEEALGDYIDQLKNIRRRKLDSGWEALSQDEKRFHNFIYWSCLRRKGHIMLKSYALNIMPRISKVLAVQKENCLENSEGDKLVQYLDLVVTWEDGRNILFDNKTSSKPYTQDSASRSPQLISYYHSSKSEYNLDAVGFIVLNKLIEKNKIKTCSVCMNNGTGGRHKTCDAIISDVRCNGEWNISTSPECNIDVIINEVDAFAEQLVINSFDAANVGIKSENWYKNFSACRTGFACEFEAVCWKNNLSTIVDLNSFKK